MEAVEQLHRKGIVHGGKIAISNWWTTQRSLIAALDLHEGNVLLRMPKPFRLANRNEIYAKYGFPKLEAIRRFDGEPPTRNVPDHAVIPAWLGAACEDVPLAESQIRLCEFGEAHEPGDNTRIGTHTPLTLRAPEQLLTQNRAPSYASEVWSLACTIFKILGLRSLFEDWNGMDSGIVVEHVDALGRLPSELWNVWEDRDKHFDKQLKRVDGQPRRLLHGRVVRNVVEARQGFDVGQMEVDEVEALEQMLRSMLVYDNEDRISVREVMKCEWMVKWALSDFERATKIWAEEERKLEDKRASAENTAEPVQVDSRTKLADVADREGAGKASRKDGLVVLREPEAAERDKKEEMFDL